MKYMDLQKIARNGVFVLGLAVVTILPVAAQPGNANNTNRVETTTRTVERDNDTDWGWLGLLGLAGLAGLLPKKQRHVEVRDNRTDQTRSGTGTTN